MRRAAAHVGLIAAIVAAAVTMGGCTANQLILYPSNFAAGSTALSMLIPRPGGKGDLQVLSLRTEGCGVHRPAAFVLVFGGNQDRAEWTVASAAEAWRPFPVEIVALNYPGYGQSTGPATLDAIAASARELFDAVRERDGRRPIFVQGNSLGAAVALSLAAERPVAGMVLQNPPPLRQLLLWWFGPMNLWIITGRAAADVPAALDTSRTAPRCHCPSVFVIAGGDLLAPPWFQWSIVTAYGGPRKIVALPWAPHNAPVEGDKLDELRGQIGWMWERTGMR
jgi:pimeloyl-ACP methyl ester carboxylesterase